MMISSDSHFETLAIMYYILTKMTKNHSDKVDYFDFKWVIDRVNFLHATRYGIGIIDYKEYLLWDENLSPSNFDNMKWSRDDSENSDYSDYMSESRYECVNDVLRRYKIYGKWFLKLEWLWYKFWFKVTGVL